MRRVTITNVTPQFEPDTRDEQAALEWDAQFDGLSGEEVRALRETVGERPDVQYVESAVWVEFSVGGRMLGASLAMTRAALAALAAGARTTALTDAIRDELDRPNYVEGDETMAAPESPAVGLEIEL